MSVEIRVCPQDRFRDLFPVAEAVFSEDIADDLVGRVEAVADPARFVCALDGDRIVGTGGAFTLSVTVPGGEVPAGGVTFVTVQPSHRRRGILRGMMRLMVDDCHSRGEPVAMLWASQAQIYQRFGYGLATVCMNFEAETASAGYTRNWPTEGTFRLFPAGEGREIVAPVYEAARRQRAGFLGRPEAWWTGILPLADKDARGGKARRLVVFETDRGAEAYAVYRTEGTWDMRGTSSTITVEEAIASTPRGTRAIWRYLFDVDLMRNLRTFRLPPDHPVLALVAEPRRLGLTIGDGLWLRIVDVVSALEGRTYGIDGRGSGRLTMELRDEYCPWNAGRWTLEVQEGRAHLSRSSEEADIALDANDLGAVYLGGWRPSALALAGRVEELKPAGLQKADALFPTAVLPWCPQEF